MKFFGEAHLQQNNLRDAVIPIDTTFPVEPAVGQLVFKDRLLYICVEITVDDIPVWVPLTNEITAYTHIQSTPSSTWTISHPLNTAHLNVQVYNELNNMVIPFEITTTNASTVTIDFGASSVQGKAVLVTGHFDGQQKPTYAYEFYQTNPETSWTINHGLGRFPMVRVFIGNQEVQPESVTFDSMNTVTVEFSTPQVGQVKLI